MRRDEVQGIAIPAIDISKLGVADADGFLQHGCKHRLKIAGRAADDLEHLRRRCLLLQGSVRSRVRCCSASNSRTFSMAMTAWSAKVVTNSIWLSVNGWTQSAVSRLRR